MSLPNILSAFELNQIFKGKPSHKKADYLWTLSTKGVFFFLTNSTHFGNDFVWCIKIWQIWTMSTDNQFFYMMASLPSPPLIQCSYITKSHSAMDCHFIADNYFVVDHLSGLCPRLVLHASSCMDCIFSLSTLVLQSTDKGEQKNPI